MSKEELEILNTNKWDESISIIKKYWNDKYGTLNINKQNGKQVLELTTGGWSENEDFIDEITGTWFWFLWWYESKRGGYYKFIYSEKIEY